jgi:hypothetical protein
MVSRETIKNEIDRVRNEHLELLYGIIKLLENGSRADDAERSRDWLESVTNTYGCLADAPISRGDQGHYEDREAMA